MRDSRASRLVIALVATAFLAGVAAGVILDRLWIPKPVIRARFGSDMPKVLDRLDLNPRQRAQADSIIALRTPGSESLMIEVAERMRAVADSVDASLRAILTAEQRLRLDSLRRGEPTMMLKRKVVGPGGGTTVDTVYPRKRP